MKFIECYIENFGRLHAFRYAFNDGVNSILADNGYGKTTLSVFIKCMLYGMEGTPYIYQGEELGMTNVRLDMDQYADIEIRNLYEDRIARGYSHESVMNSIWARGRDNARTPMQWTAGENAGFTTGTPWLPVNENYKQINAQSALADPDSVFRYYQKLIHLRKNMEIFRDGSFTLLEPENEAVFAYIRETQQDLALVVCNFTDKPQTFCMPEHFRGSQVLISNYRDKDTILRPYEAYILYTSTKGI